MDIDECSQADKFGCSHECVNTMGSAECLCPTGWSLSRFNIKFTLFLSTICCILSVMVKHVVMLMNVQKIMDCVTKFALTRYLPFQNLIIFISFKLILLCYHRMEEQSAAVKLASD